MRRLFSTFALLLCLSASLWWSGAVAHASPRFVGTAGTPTGAISGVLVNGTHHDAPVAAVGVTLQASTSHGQPKDLTTTTTDIHGHFSFGGLDVTGAMSYDVYATYQSGTFTSDSVTFANGPTQQLTLRVYDTTSSDSALHVSLATILFSPPNKQEGLIPVGEFITFDNSGTTAFVAAQGPANGMPMGLLRFALPAGATNLTLGAGFTASQQITQVNTGFAASATVPPGQSQFAFAFSIPYTSTSYGFSYKAVYATDQIAVLMPMGVAVGAGDFATQPPVTANGAHYQLFTHGAAQRDQTSALTLSQLPTPGERPYLDFHALVGLSVVLALLLALLLSLYLRRGELALVFGLVPASSLRSRARKRHSGRMGVSGADLTERRRLLRELLSLDVSHDAGKLDDATYQRRSLVTRARLRELFASELPSGGATAVKTAQALSDHATSASSSLAGEKPTPAEVSQPARESGDAVKGGKR